jgi:putative transcriptional regulator
VVTELKEKIAGEVVLSPHPGRTLRKWREDFGISQKELAAYLSTVPSVISDYESERRSSPGAAFVRRYVEALIGVDKDRGGKVAQRYSARPPTEGILGMKEFAIAVPLRSLAETLEARPASRVDLHRDIHGYTLIDAPRAILSLSSQEFVQVYGWTTQRSLIFAGVKYGRSPMVAIRAHPLKPAAVIYADGARVDPLAVRLSEVENIPLLVTPFNPKDILTRLENI